MSWPSAPAEADVLSEFTAAEAAIITKLQGGTDNLPVILQRVIAEFYDAIMASGSEIDLAGTLPQGLHSDCIALCRWRLLLTLPDAAKSLLTKGREEAYRDAREKLKMIAQQKWAVQPATATSARFGNWNSENKIIPRTHPLPDAATQFPDDGDEYANPTAPLDT